VEQLLGPPRGWRWLRILFGLAFTIAIALVIPRVDQWAVRTSPVIFFLIGIPMPALWSIHRERLLLRSKSRQIAVGVATVIAQAVGIAAFLALSVTFGPELGKSPVERLAARLPTLDISPWLLAGLLLVFALWTYRTTKREEAALRAQGAAEQGGPLAPPN
jgi:hypothetical protein